MSFVYSQREADDLLPAEQMIVDLRNAPVNKRKTKFRLMQRNILTYTFRSVIPGWGGSGVNSMPFKDVVDQSILNARSEGESRFGSDFTIDSNAVAKVTGDIYEILTSAVLWNASVHWNRYMCGEDWPASPRHQRPNIERSERRQVAVINLPRRFDWVRLLDPESSDAIGMLRKQLALGDLKMPTSTPDIAVVVLPEELRDDEMWKTPIDGLSVHNQVLLQDAYQHMLNVVEPGELILAMALKSSLRSDRLYQPLYEANVMQLLLEGHLGAPQVDFEVHALTAEGTGAVEIYKAASLHSAGSPKAHRAVRDLYVPQNANQIIDRYIGFLNSRMARVRV